MRKLLVKQLLAIALIITSITAFAQNGTLKGKVIVQGTTAVGATIKSGKYNTLTNDAGEYSISLPAGHYVFSFGYVGYQNEERTVDIKSNETTTLEVALQWVAELNEVVVLGSRAAPRTQLESPVPVDVIDLRKLAGAVPQTNINQILTYAAPSFTANTQALGDGTDHIDPASLRGLGPDQVLVLVNGKRRYTSALVNVNGTFGKGTVGTDLNAIPVASIERIEVLRDGAAAQYGSDAVAGVINVILKKETGHVTASVTGGEYYSKDKVNDLKKRDGQGIQAAINFGLPIGDKGGFINLSGSYDYRQPTDRGGTYTGVIYRRYPGGVDRTDSFLTATNTTRKDYSLHVGQSRIRSGQFAFNASLPISENATFYSFGGLGYRNGLADGFYRYPNDSRNVIDIYPLGFLPQIGSDIYDRSFAAGIKGKAQGWNVDFSNTWGQNEFIFNVQNSLNASLLKASPTSFRAGGPKFTQNTTNVDLSRNFDWLSGVNISFGGEYRFERYQLIAGEEASYTDYGRARQVGVDGSGNPILVPDSKGPVNTLFGPDGTARPGGAQVFPGYRPENAVNATRTAVAFYADAEVNLTRAFLVDAALRYENYSDFGSTTNGKVALRYKVNNQLSLRASGSTGFRAPSLHQRYYANTSTVFTSGVATDVGTFPNNSRIAQLLGIPALRPEKSKSVSAGLTGNFGRIKVTLDGYFTRINDRVVYTDQFKGDTSASASPVDKEIARLLQLANAGAAAFFANAINTETKGLDLVVSYSKKLGGGTFRIDFSGTISQTMQVGDIKVSDKLKGKESIYFSAANKIYLEAGVPNQKANFALTYLINKFEFFARESYFGGVTEATNSVQFQQYYTPKWVTDLSIGYNIAKQFKVTIGTNNLFDKYPDAIKYVQNSNSGQFVYPRSVSQYGFNGRYVFARVEVKL